MKEKEYISKCGIEWDESITNKMGYGNTRTKSYEAKLCDRRKMLTEEEREYIKNIIAPFRNKTCGIRKLKQWRDEYVLQILYNKRYNSCIGGGMWQYDAIWLPSFSNTSKVFENLEPDHIYSLDFLCL